MATPPPIISIDINTPLAKVAVLVEKPDQTYCGFDRPSSVPVTWDPFHGYLCPRHGDGSAYK